MGGDGFRRDFLYYSYIFNDVHRHIQFKAQKQHRGDKTVSSEQLPEYGNSSVLFECLMVDVVLSECNDHVIIGYSTFHNFVMLYSYNIDSNKTKFYFVNKIFLFPMASHMSFFCELIKRVVCVLTKASIIVWYIIVVLRLRLFLPYILCEWIQRAFWSS